MTEPSFAKDIKPLFREKDRNAMLRRFDLWSLKDVQDNAEAIIDAVRAGAMPCDGRWSPDDIDLLGRWIAAGMTE